MDRNEVLERLDRMASFWAESDVREGVKNGPYATALRAAAEIIRESGWRPIAEAPDIIPPGRLGGWGTEKWYEVVTQYPIPKLNASTLGYTHYCPLDKPEPPAREDSKS